MLANKFDGDCFALVGAHQHGLAIHNQDLMRERVSGVISFIIYYYYGGGVGKGELGNTKVSIVYSIRMGGGGGRGVGKNYAWGEVHPLCSLSPSVSNLIN